jgi:hypothetical protein
MSRPLRSSGAGRQLGFLLGCLQRLRRSFLLYCLAFRSPGIRGWTDMTETLIFIQAVWSATLEEFSRHKGGVERVAYLDGFAVDRTGFPPTAHPATRMAVVSSLVLPDATLAPGNYQVSAEAMSQAGSRLRSFGMPRLIQVHTHGNDWTDHSSTDDSRAYSQRPGTMSIALPRHGRGNPNLSEWSSPESCNWMVARFTTTGSAHNRRQTSKFAMPGP